MLEEGCSTAGFAGEDLKLWPFALVVRMLVSIWRKRARSLRLTVSWITGKETRSANAPDGQIPEPGFQESLGAYLVERGQAIELESGSMLRVGEGCEAEDRRRRGGMRIPGTGSRQAGRKQDCQRMEAVQLLRRQCQPWELQGRNPHGEGDRGKVHRRASRLARPGNGTGEGATHS